MKKQIIEEKDYEFCQFCLKYDNCIYTTPYVKNCGRYERNEKKIKEDKKNDLS